jgi:hypothetical protein
MKPEMRQHLLPMGLLIAGIVCGGVAWTLDGAPYWVTVGASLVLIIAGAAVAMRTGAGRRDT